RRRADRDRAGPQTARGREDRVRPAGPVRDAESAGARGAGVRGIWIDEQADRGRARACRNHRQDLPRAYHEEDAREVARRPDQDDRGARHPPATPVRRTNLSMILQSRRVSPLFAWASMLVRAPSRPRRVVLPAPSVISVIDDDASVRVATNNFLLSRG